jgi:uncharacterized membrane protein YbhN (UPF0104 family)
VTLAEGAEAVALEASGRARSPLWSALRKVVTVAVIGGAAWAAYDHRSQLSTAGSMLSRIQVDWLLIAVAAEVVSFVVFARLQRWLLRAGGVKVPLLSMVEIALAGNAMSTSLPGGPAWSATWAFGQLRRRGANRVLAGWVILVAGALSSFAVFVIVAAGAWVAGSTGPFAHLRWLAAALATVPLMVIAGFVAARHSEKVRWGFAESWQALSDHARPVRALGDFVRRTGDDLGLVRPGLTGWAEAFGLALANWLYDAAALIAVIEALHLSVPWRAVLVIYGFTQVSASLPITPGGLGVVEASMAALLVAYGTPSTSALAVVLLYRIVSFWGLVPIGWAVWFGLEIAHRNGLRNRPHPWASHEHGAEPAEPVGPVGPEWILRPEPCRGCPDDRESAGGTQSSGNGRSSRNRGSSRKTGRSKRLVA